MLALVIPADVPPTLEDIGESYPGLAARFPDGFDSLRLGTDVVGWVGDCSLLDGSPHNPHAQELVDAVYRAYAGRDCHVHVHGLMVVLGTGHDGESLPVPADFLAAFLPDLVS
jgi:hypothetical protein